jgi:hypothetical protein
MEKKKVKFKKKIEKLNFFFFRNKFFFKSLYSPNINIKIFPKSKQCNHSN